MQTPRGAGVPTSCPADSYSRSRGTVLLECLIHPFGLAITFWMITRGETRERKKWEMNSEPRLEVMWEGTPCLENTWRRKSFVSSGDVIMSCIGMNMHCLDSESTTTRIAVYLEDEGSCSMKSMEMEF